MLKGFRVQTEETFTSQYGTSCNLKIQWLQSFKTHQTYLEAWVHNDIYKLFTFKGDSGNLFIIWDLINGKIQVFILGKYTVNENIKVL